MKTIQPTGGQHHYEFRTCVCVCNKDSVVWSGSGGRGASAALLHDRSPLILSGSFSDTQGLMFHTNDCVG